ncbi:MAG: pantoate--beta-alanine ligase [Microthrixaceae bacterium]
METISSIADLRALLKTKRENGAEVGLVPTMGYLHDGHVSLISQAASECDVIVATIFVNPLQFAAGEDLDAYPRDPAGDAAKAEAAGVSILFTPDLTEMYPHGRDSVLTTVAVPALASVMEGSSRPTHFAGVCTVVAKIFNIVEPNRAYFGEKDYQQLAIIRQMASDLSFPVAVVGCQTLRESDGLAMSSRNVYLSPEERKVATILREALGLGANAILGGERSSAQVKKVMERHIETQTLGALDYVEVADPDTLQPREIAELDARLFGAIQFSKARLIDNRAVVERSVVDHQGSAHDSGGQIATKAAAGTGESADKGSAGK